MINWSEVLTFTAAAVISAVGLVILYKLAMWADTLLWRFKDWRLRRKWISAIKEEIE